MRPIFCCIIHNLYRLYIVSCHKCWGSISSIETRTTLGFPFPRFLFKSPPDMDIVGIVNIQSVSKTCILQSNIILRSENFIIWSVGFIWTWRAFALGKSKLYPIDQNLVAKTIGCIYFLVTFTTTYYCLFYLFLLGVMNKQNQY